MAEKLLALSDMEIDHGSEQDHGFGPRRHGSTWAATGAWSRNARGSMLRFLELDADKRIWWGPDGGGMPRLKRYLSEVKKGVVPQTLWLHAEVGHTQDAKKELVSILEFEKSEDVFNTVKPTSLIRRILQIATDKDSIVLDSFAGSGTTAHAVLALNKEDGGSRRFVLIECEDYVDSIKARWYVGRSLLYDVFLVALTLDMARALPPHEENGRQRLVFAPTKYLDQEFLNAYRITFQQLPFQIYETVAQTARRRAQDGRA